MSKHETLLQWLKVVLLGAILCFALWSVGTRPPAVNAQLAASSGFQFKHVTTATNTQEASASVILHTVTINGGTAGVVTVKDTSASDCSGGATIAVIETIGTTNPVTLAYDLQTANGLCVTTAAASDVTVSFR